MTGATRSGATFLRGRFKRLVVCLCTTWAYLYSLVHRRPLVIMTGEYGRLGNALVRFAHLISAARRMDFHVVDTSFGRYATLFAPTARDVLCRFPFRGSWIPSSQRAGNAMTRLGVRLGRHWRRAARLPGWMAFVSLEFYEYDPVDARQPDALLQARHFDLGGQVDALRPVL